MYPIRLNLVSKRKQQYIKRMMTMSFIKNSLAIVFIVLSLFAIFAIFSQLFLQAYFADITLQTIRTNSPEKEINGRVLRINTTTKQADAIQSQYRSWSPVITTVFNAIPSSVTVSTIAIRQVDGLLELAGSASSREALLELKTSLESLDQIKVVDVPLNDLTKQDEIPFTFAIPYQY